MTADPQNHDRLRQPPQERFAVDQLNIDLTATTKRLRAEPRAGEHGHRQETLYKSAGSTIALFAFDRFTNLAEHKAAGIVQIQVLRGKFKITAGGNVHELAAGQMLILGPGVPHAVGAEEEGEILVTVLLS